MKAKIKKISKTYSSPPPGRCSMCGKTLDFLDTQQNLVIHKDMKYGSKYDLHTVHLQLCCECFDNLVDSCKVSPVLGGVSDEI